MAEDAGFGETQAEQVAIVVTEACTNLLKHAKRGEVLLCTTEDSQATPGLEVLVLDQGPGMPDLQRCLRDGFSTGSSPGQGLGAIVRLSTISDFYSTPNQGTVVLARWSLPSRNLAMGALQIGAVNVCKPGQDVCGDSWGVEQTADYTVILVADGLGHGPEARMASVEAVRMLHLNPDLPPVTLLERVHQALRSSRGAAVAVAHLDRRRRVVRFAGAGNIAAQIYSGSKLEQHLVSVNGTAGHQMNRLHEFDYPWPELGMLVFHSDGLTTGTRLEAHPGLALRDASLIAGVLYRDSNRGHDDSTVVVAKAP